MVEIIIVAGKIPIGKITNTFRNHWQNSIYQVTNFLTKSLDSACTQNTWDEKMATDSEDSFFLSNSNVNKTYFIAITFTETMVGNTEFLLN